MKTGIINEVNYVRNDDIYSNHHFNYYIQKESRLPISAYTVDIFDRQKNLVSTFGELFEREVLIDNNQSFDNAMYHVFSLLTGEVKEVDKYMLVFRDKFVDSCGMASHYISGEVVQKALMEFLERQCYICNYLSKSKGQRIDINIIMDNEVNAYNKYLLHYVDEIQYYDISMMECMHVVIAIGYGEIHRCVGIGTHFYVPEAIKKAQQEMLQYIPNEMSKYNHKSLGYLEFQKKNVDDVYNNYFFGLSNEELKEMYRYLIESPEIRWVEKQDCRKKIPKTIDIVKSINERYGMEPYISFFKSKRNISNLKVVKIIDFNWFPHMYPKLYEERIYRYVEMQTRLELDRECEVLPFA